jgi:hypothetical protein
MGFSIRMNGCHYVGTSSTIKIREFTCSYLTFTSFTTVTCLDHIILIFNQSFTLQELVTLTKGWIQ